MKITLAAKPEAINLDTDKTAVIIVDMQNGFCKPGGMLDIAGRLDESRVTPVVAASQAVIAAARSKGIGIVYLRMSYRADMSNTGGPDSPHYWKEHGVRMMRDDPEKRGKIMTIGTWDWEIIDELKPAAGDIVVNKNRYSGFFNTELDAVLRQLGARHLLFCGFATNVCVESTLRDAFFHDYFPVLVSDGCGNAGPEFLQAATEWNVAELFGWVTTSADLLKALD
jgi:ureidoacrylate peracid hydrolase